MSVREASKATFLLLIVSTLSGCWGGANSIALPSFDPDEIAAKAMELYDSDGDGIVAGAELENAPGIRAGIKTLDSDQDGGVSEAEVAERVRVWDQTEIGMMMFDSIYILDGRPLANAEITFEPDGFLEGIVETAVGTTDLGGNTRVKIPKENRPSADTPPGMQAGFYKVRISKMVGGKETIPAKYNTETILGQEVSMDDWAISNRQVIFKMKSK